MREIKPKTFKFGKEQKEKSLENGVFSRLFGGGGCEIRTHAPVKANGFQDRLVMTTSITLREYDATMCIIFTELLRCGSA